jgi:tetratricopeptide (TPR) repeat protein
MKTTLLTSFLSVTVLVSCATAPVASSGDTPPERPAATRPRPSQADAARYQELLAQATQAEERDDHQAALRILEDARMLVPDEPMGHVLTGVVMSSAGQTTAAAVEFKRGIELAHDPDIRKQLLEIVEKTTSSPRSREEAGLYKGAFTYIEAKQPDLAVPLLRNAVALNPRNARTRYELGYALVELGRIDEAIVEFEEARRINPVSEKILIELQYCYGERNRYREMTGLIADRILVEGENARLLHDLGFNYAADGNVDLAISTLEQNLRRFPDFFLSHFSLGQLYCDKRKDKTAGQAHFDAFIVAAERARSSGQAASSLLTRDKLQKHIQDAQQARGKCGVR